MHPRFVRLGLVTDREVDCNAHSKYAQNAENAKKNAEREQQHDQSGTPSSSPQQGHGDIAPPKAEGAQ